MADRKNLLSGDAEFGGLIEKRAIEYIPLRERHGRPWHVTPVWIACSSNLTGLAVGSIGLISGLNLLWSLVAIVVGALFGTFFAAFHASQGPQMGIPQMIQSRPQYGYRGAALIYVVAIIAYLGINIFAIVLAGQAVAILLNVPTSAGMVVISVLAIALAIGGYDLVHRVSRYSTIAFVVVLTVLGVAAPIVLHLPAGSVSTGHFTIVGFMLQASTMAVATLSWAPYVSDYTRYLPHLSTRASFFGTYLGMALTAVAVSGIAAVITAGTPGRDIVSALYAVGNDVFPRFGAIALGVTLFGTALLVSMNTYGASLTLMSVADSFRPSEPRPLVRPMIAVAFGALSLFLAFRASSALLQNFSNFLTILFYALAPWTATNLTDFFFVRRGHYSVREIFNPDGMYGRWNWRGYAAYIAAFAAMAPFAVTAWWTGSLARQLGYDIAPFVGMAVSALVYLVLAKGMDLDGERELIAIADADLEATTESALDVTPEPEIDVTVDTHEHAQQRQEL
ncbi:MULTISPECIES: purine-cytosine permease family protein [Streptomyces]|uniref:purine-cytosine permease family protein n=1 Tax=Streptomyces TaxID=1883 RepID=UPI0015C508C2|nr:MULTISPECIES: cytosine permease [Streptomyces]MDX3612185.1 cytosine permease [Streptomyces europaeiscabiei]MDX3630418.1 cytosine permease [Streptomyces europaeiscabiei]MDX3648555.1 cytosine permease [Streptomyces europaeiscabiei]